MPEVAPGKPERLFIGVPIPARTRELLSRQLPASLPGKPSPSANWHFTLRFLGDTEPVLRDRLIDELAHARLGRPFEVAFDRLGAFPNPRHAKILWAGVGKGREKLETVAGIVESAVVKAGFPREERKFSAHLTLSRLNPPKSIGALLSSVKGIDAGMRVEEVLLYRSELGGPHSRYAVIESFSLGSR